MLKRVLIAALIIVLLLALLLFAADWAVTSGLLEYMMEPLR
jgi:hypothetical protein